MSRKADLLSEPGLPRGLIGDQPANHEAPDHNKCSSFELPQATRVFSTSLIQNDVPYGIASSLKL